MVGRVDLIVLLRLSLNGHLYKTDTSIKRTPGVGPCAPFFSHFTASKLSISQTPL